MPQRRKGLEARIADGTFEARREAHRELLLTDDLVRDQELRRVQQRFRRTRNEERRRAVALEFEQTIRGGHEERVAKVATELEVELAKLGPPESAKQAIAFFPRFLRHDDGRPWHLDRWQQEMIRETFRRHVVEELEQRVYKEILWGLSRGLGKTPLATGLGLCTLLARPRPKVFQGAGSKDQAKLGVAYGTDWVDDSPELSQWLSARASSITRRDGRGSYSILSAAGSLGHGRKPDVGILDEEWAFLTAAQEQTKIALETALHKVLDSYLLSISTAGHSKASLLGRSFDAFMKLDDIRTYRGGFLTVARDEDAGRLMWWYGMPEGFELDLEDDVAVMRAVKLAHPGSWVNHREILRALRRMMAKGEELEWLRLYLNAWTKVAKAWLRAGVWPACAQPELEIPNGARVYVAVDAAHSYDTTAVAWAWISPDGVTVVRARVFSVRDDAPAHTYVSDFYDPDSDDHVAERFILGELARRYRIVEVVGDPNYFGRELARLGRRFTTAPLFPQSKEMREYVQGFYQDAHERRLAHDGDRVLRDHVEGIAGRQTTQGYYAIEKLNEPNPIDGGVAAIMARGRAIDGVKAAVAARSVYNERDLLVVEGELEDDDELEDVDDERALIRRRAHAERAALATRLVGRVSRLAEPVPWDELDELEAAAVAGALAAAAARLRARGQRSRAKLCMEELARRPIDANE